MKLKSLRAVPLPPDLFTSADARPRRWHEGTDLLNPLARHREFAGQADRFATPWQRVICIAEAENGEIGIGMSDHAGPVMPIINDWFAPMLAGENVMATERMWTMMHNASRALTGAAGFASYAISAVDLALWDLKGKLLDRPVYELLGGPAREEIRCYATGLDLDWYLECGFEAIKLCCLQGAAETTRAAAAIEGMVAGAREHLGDEFDLMLDMWPVQDLSFTVELGERLAAYDLRWIEDYLPADDLAGYAEVRIRLPGLTLAAGERWHTDKPFAHIAAARSVDILQPDVLWVGGVTASMKIARIAEAFGLDIAMHAGLNDCYGQHLCYALPGNRWSEFFVASAPGEDLAHGYRPTPGMALPVDGKLVPSDAPGFGLALSKRQLAALR